ncbi:MAG: UPF0262 family protein [Alphaproteobacteria bacterium]|nr:UPF0262 family protein [Alphaproteobacteria bacterium]
MADDRIIEITLDEASLVSSIPEVEHERAVAIYDLLEENSFDPVGEFSGPYAIHLAVEDANRLAFHIKSATHDPIVKITMGLSPFRRIIRDYFKICESYFDAIKRLSPSQIETIDMARRAVHNEGSDILSERLREKIKMDTLTARRLFTLICVLHIKG